MKLKIEITMDNAAFEENPQEINDILRRLAEHLNQDSLASHIGCAGIGIMDTNGNRVGEARVTR